MKKSIVFEVGPEANAPGVRSPTATTTGVEEVRATGSFPCP